MSSYLSLKCFHYFIGLEVFRTIGIIISTYLSWLLWDSRSFVRKTELDKYLFSLLFLFLHDFFAIRDYTDSKCHWSFIENDRRGMLSWDPFRTVWLRKFWVAPSKYFVGRRETSTHSSVHEQTHTTHTVLFTSWRRFYIL